MATYGDETPSPFSKCNRGNCKIGNKNPFGNNKVRCISINHGVQEKLHECCKSKWKETQRKTSKEPESSQQSP
jgi:hypothetical protein